MGSAGSSTLLVKRSTVTVTLASVAVFATVSAGRFASLTGVDMIEPPNGMKGARLSRYPANLPTASAGLNAMADGPGPMRSAGLSVSMADGASTRLEVGDVSAIRDEGRVDDAASVLIEKTREEPCRLAIVNGPRFQTPALQHEQRSSVRAIPPCKPPAQARDRVLDMSPPSPDSAWDTALGQGRFFAREPHFVDVLQRVGEHPAKGGDLALTPRVWKHRFADAPLRAPSRSVPSANG